MTRHRRTTPLAIVVCAALCGGCAHDRPAVTDSGTAVLPVPAALKVPDTQVLTVAARGAGVQIYVCQASGSDPARFAWTLKAPEATLRYQAGRELGRHYAGPTWEANDGSKVVGELVAHDDGTDPTAIPWLLLRARQTEGSGIFGNVQSIQRLHTVGGRAPTTGCDSGYSGTETRVAYSADYYFYAARR